MVGETVTLYGIKRKVNWLYNYTTYDVRPALEDKIVFEIAKQALYPRDEDPHPTEVDDRGFDIATWQGLTCLELSQALPPGEVSARAEELRVAFEEMGFAAEITGSTSLEGDAPY